MAVVPTSRIRRRGAILTSASVARGAQTRPMASATDPRARLYRKGEGMDAKLCFMGHALMENRHGLIVDACVTQADPRPRRGGAPHLHGSVGRQDRLRSAP